MDLLPQRRHSSIGLILLLLVSAVLAACGGAPAVTTPAAPTTAAEPAAAAPATPAAASAPTTSARPADAADDQVLHLATGSNQDASFTFTPLQGGGDQQNWQTLMWMPPMYFNENLELKPGVFDTWKPNADFTVWTFTIDKRAKWSDGTPITTADVKGAWELMAMPTTRHGRIKGYIGKVKGFDDVNTEKTKDMAGLVAKDDHTIEVTLEVADPLFNWRLATTHMNPVKAEQAKAAPEEFWKPENKPAVSGPYMLESYNPDGGEATLVKNPNWWLGEGQYLDKITFKFVPQGDTVTTMVQNNEVDASLVPLSRSFAKQIPDFFRPIKAFGFNTFWLATTVEPTDDPNVRKALALAVNSDDVFKAAFPEGGAQPAKQMLDPDFTCIDKNFTGYKYDPAAAKAALAASKYGSADKLPKLRVTPRGAAPELNRALETVVEFWRQNLGITNIEFKALPTEFGPDATKINLSRDDVVIRFPDTATYMWTAADSAGPIAKEMLLGYKNPDLDKMLEQALATPVDDPKRCDLALQAQRTFLNDYPLLLIGIPETTLNARDYVKNYAKGPDVTLIEPWKIYIAKH
jgi:peptide/nickel transport system substrate-binding protein